MTKPELEEFGARIQKIRINFDFPSPEGHVGVPEDLVGIAPDKAARLLELLEEYEEQVRQFVGADDPPVPETELVAAARGDDPAGV